MRFGRILVALAAATAVAVLGGAVGAQAGADGTAAFAESEPAFPDTDVRAASRANVPFTAAQRAALKELPGVTVRRNELQGVPSLLIRYGGYLTGPSEAAPGAIAKDYLEQNAALFRLDRASLKRLFVGKAYGTQHNGARHVFFHQRDAAGRIVYGSAIQFTIDRNGRIVIAGGPYAPGPGATGVPALSAAQAVAAAAQSVGVSVNRPLHVISSGRGASRRTVFRNTLARGASRLTAELVSFPMPAGQPARLAWKTVTELTQTGWYESVVDARSGASLFRRNYYADNHGPQGDVFTAEHPEVAGATQQQDVSFAGWSITGQTTTSNNVVAYQDLTDADALGYQPTTPASPDPEFQHFDYAFGDWWDENGTATLTLQPAGTAGYPDADSTITQMFYYTNVMHDYLYALGFDEASGNFQADGGDPVNAEAQDGWDDGVALHCPDGDGNPDTRRCQNNANFGTPADGSSPRMQMFMWTTPFRDGAMDGDVIAHEYGHGVSNRLVGGGSLGSGLQTGAMGEGWSDFISVAKWDDNRVGEYVTGNTTTGIRPWAFDASPADYSMLCAINGPFPSCQVHADGQIWVATLYDMRADLIARYGAETGKQEAIQLVIDGMKSTISSPSFLDARDGILAADVTTNASANQCLIWGAFAGREMGFSASSSGSGDNNPTEATDGPAACTPTANIGGPYVTDEGTDEPLNATASLNPGDPINPPLTYEWDLDNDSQYDDATGPNPSFTMVGQDGVFPIGLRVTNGYGFTDTDSASVTVNNVAPTVSVDTDAPKTENAMVTITGTVTDPGWLESLTASIDWGDGTPVEPIAGALENARPDATLSFSISHVYGDNGTFIATVTGFDDDTFSVDSVPNMITNVDPTAVIDESSGVLINGQVTILGEAGAPTSFSGRSVDPGSDDLHLTWNWNDGTPPETITYLVGVGPDPFPSPSIDPRDVTDPRSHTFGDACLYSIGYHSTDDDGGVSPTDTANVIIVGNADEPMKSERWRHEFQHRDHSDFTDAQLECYLAITGYTSLAFNETRDASTIEAAELVLRHRKPPEENELRKLDEELLAAWLNFANGGIGLAQLVDTDKDHVLDTPFSAVMTNAETIRNDPNSTRRQLHDERELLKRVNDGHAL